MKKLLLLLHLIFLISCSHTETIDSSEDNKKQIEENQLTLLHGINSKKWSVTQYYDNYYKKFKSEKYNTCKGDDFFLFKKNDQEVEIINGTNNCFENYGIIIKEKTTASYNYDTTSKTLYLSFGGNATFNNRTSYSESILLSCLQLTENKMIFTNGGEQNKGVGIVFEAVN